MRSTSLTLLELTSAPRGVRDVLNGVPAGSREDVVLDEEAAVLAEEYVSAGVRTRRQWVDAQHIVNLQRIHG